MKEKRMKKPSKMFILRGWDKINIPWIISAYTFSVFQLIYTPFLEDKGQTKEEKCKSVNKVIPQQIGKK